MEYILYCDESRQNDIKYGDFFGGCIISSKDLATVTGELERCKIRNNLRNEIKWTKVTEQYLDKYVQVMHLFFSFVISKKVKVRIMFRKTENQYPDFSKSDKYFKLYYQFIKHSFGFMYMRDMQPFNLRIYLDQLPAKREDCLRFKSYLANMPNTMDFRESSLRISQDQIAEVRSHEHVLLQCVDIVMGAMQFRLNNHHKDKPEGQQYRGKRTIAKEKLYKVILQEICKTHPRFNISISTGMFGRENAYWEDPYRHWLFKPNERVSYLEDWIKKFNAQSSTDIV